MWPWVEKTIARIADVAPSIKLAEELTMLASLVICRTLPALLSRRYLPSLLSSGTVASHSG